MRVPLNVHKMDWRLSLILYTKEITFMSPSKSFWEVLEDKQEYVAQLNSLFNGDAFDKGFVRLSEEQQEILRERFAKETALGTIASQQSTTTKRIKGLIEKAIGRLEKFDCLDSLIPKLESEKESEIQQPEEVKESVESAKTQDFVEGLEPKDVVETVIEVEVETLVVEEVKPVEPRKRERVSNTGLIPRVKRETRPYITTLGLGFRINNLLKAAGFEFVDEIITKSAADFSSIKGLGEKSVKQLCDKLAGIK